MGCCMGRSTFINRRTLCESWLRIQKAVEDNGASMEAECKI